MDFPNNDKYYKKYLKYKKKYISLKSNDCINCNDSNCKCNKESPISLKGGNGCNCCNKCPKCNKCLMNNCECKCSVCFNNDERIYCPKKPKGCI